MRLWDAASGQQILALVGHEGEVGHVAFSGDGRLLLTVARGSNGAPPEIRLWDARPLVNSR